MAFQSETGPINHQVLTSVSPLFPPHDNDDNDDNDDDDRGAASVNQCLFFAAPI